MITKITFLDSKQILPTRTIGNIWRTVMRICTLILGFQGLKEIFIPCRFSLLLCSCTCTLQELMRVHERWHAKLRVSSVIRFDFFCTVLIFCGWAFLYKWENLIMCFDSMELHGDTITGWSASFCLLINYSAERLFRELVLYFQLEKRQ